MMNFQNRRLTWTTRSHEVISTLPRGAIRFIATDLANIIPQMVQHGAEKLQSLRITLPLSLMDEAKRMEMNVLHQYRGLAEQLDIGLVQCACSPPTVGDLDEQSLHRRLVPAMYN